MNNKDEKWAIFWCDLLHPIIFSEIEESQINQWLKECSQEERLFPNGQTGKPSLSTLRRKLNRYRTGGFEALAKKPRNDRDQPRNVNPQIIATAIELKKEQPRRSPNTINRFLKDLYGVTVPRSTLYRHLKDAGATRLKLGIVKKKVRKRWSRDHTHDLWVGDFEEGPYVLLADEILPTYLCAFIDCHSRYAVEARYYLRQNLDILIDSLIRALAKHGAPSELYLDNAKVYHSNALKAACYRIHTRLIYRTPGDPSPGGLIERFFGTVQEQFEAEVRAQDLLTLDQLNRAFAAWLNVSYHQHVHSETEQMPKQRYETGLTVIRQVDMDQVLASFMQKVTRRVHKDFSDVQLHNRFYRVTSRLRGDSVQLHYDPFSDMNTVQIYSHKGQYLGKGTLHHRQIGETPLPSQPQGKPKHNLLDLLIQQHREQLLANTKGIDYRKVITQRAWPFHAFAKTFAHILEKPGTLTAFTVDELETLKKFYNKNPSLTEAILREACQRANNKSIPYVLYEIKEILKRKEQP